MFLLFSRVYSGTCICKRTWNKWVKDSKKIKWAGQSIKQSIERNIPKSECKETKLHSYSTGDPPEVHERWKLRELVDQTQLLFMNA